MLTSDQDQFSEEDSRRLIVAITDFLRDQLTVREDLQPEDRDCLEIAIQCLEMAYGLDPNGYVQLRFTRPLLDVFSQVTNPVPVRDKLRADAHKDRGNEYMLRSMYRNAEAEYTAAIELDRWNSIFYCNRAGARIAQQNYFDAIADCRQALMLNPDYAKAYGRMGQAYALLNRPREAARCFRQALQLDPRNERYRTNLGVAENQSQRSDVLGLFSGVLGSIFGSGSQTAPRTSSTRMPPSFMILAERPASASDTSQRNIQNVRDATRTERRNVFSSPLHGATFPTSFGATDSKSTRTSTQQADRSPDGEGDEDSEAVVSNPEYSFFPDVVPVSCPCQKGYDFAPQKSGKIDHAPMCPKKSGSMHSETLDYETDVSLGIKNTQPNVDKVAESSNISGPESSKNISTDTPKAQDAVFEHISSHTPNGSIGIKSSQPKIEKNEESSKPSAPESSERSATDKSQAQDTDSKKIPSHATAKQSVVSKWPSNDERNKLKKDDGRNKVASPSDIQSATAEKNVANCLLKADSRTADKTEESGQSEVRMPSPLKTIRSESELFETISQVSNVSRSKDQNENLDEKSKVTDENESRDKPEDSNS